MTSKSPVGDISVVTLIRTDTTLDHSQKAEKVISGRPERARIGYADAYAGDAFPKGLVYLLQV